MAYPIQPDDDPQAQPDQSQPQSYTPPVQIQPPTVPTQVPAAAPATPRPAPTTNPGGFSTFEPTTPTAASALPPVSTPYTPPKPVAASAPAPVRPAVAAPSQVQSASPAAPKQPPTVPGLEGYDPSKSWDQQTDHVRGMLPDGAPRAATYVPALAPVAVPKSSTTTVDSPAVAKFYTRGQDGTLQFDPTNSTAGVLAAFKNGEIDDKAAATLLDAAKRVDSAKSDLEKMAGEHPQLKSLAEGLSTGGAFLAGGAATASAATPLNAAIGTATAPVAWATVPAAEMVEFLGGGMLTAWAKKKLEAKASEYSDALKSFQASAQLYPKTAMVGELLPQGPGAIKSIGNLAKIGGIAAEDLGPAATTAQKLMAGAKAVAKPVAAGALGGAAAEGIGRPVVSYAADKIADAAGIEHEETQAPTLGSITQMAGLGALLAAHKGIGFENYSDNQLGSILVRGGAHDQAGVPMHEVIPPADVASRFGSYEHMTQQDLANLGQPLSPAEQELYVKASSRLKELDAQGKLNGPFTGLARQVTRNGAPIGVSSVDLRSRGQGDPSAEPASTNTLLLSDGQSPEPKDSPSSSPSPSIAPPSPEPPAPASPRSFPVSVSGSSAGASSPQPANRPAAGQASPSTDDQDAALRQRVADMQLALDQGRVAPQAREATQALLDHLRGQLDKIPAASPASKQPAPAADKPASSGGSGESPAAPGQPAADKAPAVEDASSSAQPEDTTAPGESHRVLAEAINRGDASDHTDGKPSTTFQVLRRIHGAGGEVTPEVARTVSQQVDAIRNDDSLDAPSKQTALRAVVDLHKNRAASEPSPASPGGDLWPLSGGGKKDAVAPKKRGSTQLTLSPLDAASFQNFAKSIPDDLLYSEKDPVTEQEKYGRELEPHITSLYGLHGTGDHPDAVAAAIKDHGPVTAHVGKLSTFSNPDSPYDVVKAGIHSPSLHALNARLRGLEHTSDYPDYKPHLTLAYVKKGEGKRFEGSTAFRGRTLTFDRLTHSSAERTKTDLPLGKIGEAAQQARKEVVQRQGAQSDLDTLTAKQKAGDTLTPEETQRRDHAQTILGRLAGERQPAMPAGKDAQRTLRRLQDLRDRGVDLNGSQRDARRTAELTLARDLNTQVLGADAPPTSEAGQRAQQQLDRYAPDIPKMNAGQMVEIHGLRMAVENDRTAQRAAIEAKQATSGKSSSAPAKPRIVAPAEAGDDTPAVAAARNWLADQHAAGNQPSAHEIAAARGLPLATARQLMMDQVDAENRAARAALSAPAASDLGPITAERAEATAKKAITNNRQLLHNLGISEVKLGEMKGDSGVEFRPDGSLIIDPHKLAESLTTVRDNQKELAKVLEVGNTPEDWFFHVLTEEGTHGVGNVLAREAGQSPEQFYESVPDEAYPPDWQEKGRGTYGKGWDNLPKWKRKAEFVRMTLQGKYFGKITEALANFLDPFVAYFKRLASLEGIDPRLKSFLQRYSDRMAAALKGNAEAPAKKTPKSFKMPDAPHGQRDIIDAITENGGMLSRPRAIEAAKRNGTPLSAHYDPEIMPGTKGTGIYHQKIFGGTKSPDKMAAGLNAGDGMDTASEQRFDDGTVEGMYREIDRALQARRTTREEMKRQATVEKQAGRFDKDALTADTAKGKTEVNTGNLNVGDHVTVGGERLKVTHVDPDTLDITLEDHTKYGVQHVADNTALYVEKVEPGEGRELGAARPERVGSRTGDLFSSEDEPFTLRGEPGSESERVAAARARANAPAEPKTDLPRLRSGERQGDLLSKQAEDFRLVGERGIDHGARQTAQEQSAQESAQARAKQNREQGALFAGKPAPVEPASFQEKASIIQHAAKARLTELQRAGEKLHGALGLVATADLSKITTAGGQAYYLGAAAKAHEVHGLDLGGEFSGTSDAPASAAPTVPVTSDTPTPFHEAAPIIQQAARERMAALKAAGQEPPSGLGMLASHNLANLSTEKGQPNFLKAAAALDRQHGLDLARRGVTLEGDPVSSQDSGLTAAKPKPAGEQSPDPSRVGSVKDLVDRALTAGSGERKQYADLGTVSDEQATRLKADTGLDLAGYRRNLDNMAVRHVMREHGDAVAESARGNVPLSREDFERLPQILENPDASILAGKNSRGQDVILHAKRVNGYFVVAEEVRERRGLLSLSTLYKKSAPPLASGASQKPDAALLQSNAQAILRQAADSFNFLRGSSGSGDSASLAAAKPEPFDPGEAATTKPEEPAPKNGSPLQTAKDFIAGRIAHNDLTDTLSKTHDAGDTMANVDGRHEQHSVEMDFDRGQDKDAQRQARVDRWAAGPAFEAGGRRAELAADLEKVKSSPDKALAGKYAPHYQRALAQLDSLHAKNAGARQIKLEQDSARDRAGLDGDKLTRTRHTFGDPGEPERALLPDDGLRTVPGYKKAADAIAAGVDPRTLDVAEMVGHHVYRTRAAINEKAYHDKLAGMTATDGKPLLSSIEDSSSALNSDGSVSSKVKVPRGYQAVQAGDNVLVAHDEVAPLLKAQYGDDAIRNHWLGGAALDFAALIKHGAIGIDTFHGAQVAMRGLLGYQITDPRSALASLNYANKDLDRAVQQGRITKAQADNVRENRRVDQLGLKHGVNVGKATDNLLEAAQHANLIEKIPGVGKVAKWTAAKTFGVVQPAYITAAFRESFARNTKSYPELSESEVARKSATEVNEFFGNLGTQGFLKSRTMRSAARLLLFAPGFAEGRARTEFRGGAQAGKTFANGVRGKGWQIGSVARSMGQILLASLIGAQVLNLFTRGKPTWENDEEGHRWDAYIPGGKHGFFWSPLSLCAEFSHAMLKYVEGGQSGLDALLHVGSNKLSGLSRVGLDLATGHDGLGRPFDSTAERVKAALLDASPLPMQTAALVKKDPKSPLGLKFHLDGGEAIKTALNTAGIRVDAGKSARAQMYHLAEPFRAQQPGNQPHVPSKYAKLRGLLEDGDLDGGRDELKRLVAGGTKPDKIRRAFNVQSDGTVKRPLFTGNLKTEKTMLDSLTTAQRRTYEAAKAEHGQIGTRLKQAMGGGAPLASNPVR